MFVGERPVRGNVILATVRWENVCLGNCLFGELSVWGTFVRRTLCWENLFGELSVGGKSIGVIFIGELSYNVFCDFISGILQIYGDVEL